jgi:hypothetical protein
LLPDTDPIYSAGWSFILGRNPKPKSPSPPDVIPLERPKPPPKIPQHWKDKTDEKCGETLTIIGARRPARPQTSG